ncbi:hypothetical protein [Brevibacillus laterosporus]|uniref:hypothetical protein n=1 Tax=Brevibacillus laterosporus TaxID=1465 RepID=UPI000839B5BE|nr:hypothetical protein [Brevibacillus laterosporus]
MNHNQIEIIAIAAQKGCEKSKELVYKDFIPIINDYVNRNWYKVQNEASLTKELIDALDQAIKDFDVEKGSFSRLARFNLERCFRKFIKRRKYNRTDNIPLEREIDDEGNTIIDTLADVFRETEQEMIIKESINEKIALLAKGDSRKKAILLAWSDGFYNDSALSELLAQLFGGKPDSHRRSITRFRSFCQTTLPRIV